MPKGITPLQAQKIRETKGLKDTRLQSLRVLRGLSQSALASKSGVSIRAIQIYEQNARDIDRAKLSTLCKLCNALDCKIPDILESKALIELYESVK